MPDRIAVLFWLILPSASHGTPSCVSKGSNSITLTWPQLPDTDVYMVEVSVNRTSLPFSIETTSNTTAKMSDLLINQTYCFNVRSHPESAPSIVWHWRPRNTSQLVCCSTEHSGQRPHSFLINQLNPNVQVLSWSDPQRDRPPTLLSFSKHGSSERVLATSNSSRHVISTTKNGCLEHIDCTVLAAATAYSLQVTSGSMTSDLYTFHTPSVNTSWLSVYRVSEYTDEVDFLRNHDSASLEGQAAFLTNTNSALFFNVSLDPPVSRYCIQRAAVEWAPYVSCNGPEAEPRNRPEHPMCICDVWADRMIALQNATVFNQSCESIEWNSDGSHNAPDCACTDSQGTRSKWVIDPASEVHTGRNPVYLPFFYYQVPAESYADISHFGYFYSHPAKGQCKTRDSMTSDGCSWYRNPRAHVVRGDHLLRLGWNATSVPHWPLHKHGPNTTKEVLTNLPLFKQAWQDIDALTLPRCCGC